LIEGVDYSVSYEDDNTAVGTVRYTVHPLSPNLAGADYHGSFEIITPQLFMVDPIPNKTFSFVYENNIPDLTFKDVNGNPLALQVGVDYNFRAFNKTGGEDNHASSWNSNIRWNNEIVENRPFRIKIEGVGIYQGCNVEADFMLEKLDLAQTDPADWQICGTTVYYYGNNTHLTVAGTGASWITYKGKYIEYTPRAYSLLKFSPERDGSIPQAGNLVTHARYRSNNIYDGYKGYIDIPFDQPIEIQPVAINDTQDTRFRVYAEDTTQTYDGSYKEPDIFRGMVKGTDYTAVYANNKNAGTASFVVTGIGNYTGVRSDTFIIKPFDVTGVGAISIEPIADVEFSGQAVEPALDIKDKNGNELVVGRDYSVNYVYNDRPGQAYAYVTGKGNYTGNFNVTFNITASMNGVAVAAVPDQIIDASLDANLGAAPKVNVSLATGQGSYTLREGVDYEVECPAYASLTLGQPATLTVVGKGGFVGTSKTADFTPVLQATFDGSPVVYGSKPAAGQFALVDDGGLAVAATDYEVTTFEPRTAVGDAGKAYIKVAAGDYAGVEGYAAYTVNTKASALLEAKAEGAALGTSEESAADFSRVYSGRAVTFAAAKLDVKDGSLGDLLLAGSDYKVEYIDNVNAGVAKMRVSILDSSPNYAAASREFYFSITPYSITAASALKITAIGEQTWTGEAIKPAVVASDNNGNSLVAGRDYDASYSSNVDAGDGFLLLEGKGNYSGSRSVLFTIKDRIAIDGSVGLGGSGAAFTILDGASVATGKPAEFSSERKYVYTGAEIRPAIGLGVPQGAVLSEGVDFVVEYASNVGVGRASITIKGIGAYKGALVTGFEIVPRTFLDSAVPVADLPKLVLAVAPGQSGALPKTLDFGGGVKADVVWESADLKIARISDGKIVGVAEGKVTLVAKALPGLVLAEGKTCALTVTIAKPVTAVRTALSSIVLVKGRSVALPVVAYSVDARGRADTVAKLAWETSNGKVATVGANGKIKAVKAGSAVVSAMALNGQKLLVKVKVVTKSKAVSKVTVKAPSSLKRGKTAVLSVKLKPAGATAQVVKFTSSKKSVLTVDKAGRVTALKKGSAKITVSIGGKKVVKKIKVK
jgi:hypothetical protein